MCNLQLYYYSIKKNTCTQINLDKLSQDYTVFALKIMSKSTESSSEFEGCLLLPQQTLLN